VTVRGRGDRPRLDSVDLTVRAGEIVGIAGVEGNGQSELLEAIAGLLPVADLGGEILLEGTSVTRLPARRRKELGVAHVPEDRHRRGLLLDFDLAENAILGKHHDRRLLRGGGTLLDRDAINRQTDRLIEEFDVRPADRRLTARALSGGNQQKLILGREIGAGPRLLLVAQPTRGVDIGAIEFIHRKLIELRDAGCAILLISAELEEVTALSDRLFVIHEGRLGRELDPRTATLEEIGLMMTGGRAA
jgi:general nucleoside transport system ATP-binding protein